MVENLGQTGFILFLFAIFAGGASGILGTFDFRFMSIICGCAAALSVVAAFVMWVVAVWA